MSLIVTVEETGQGRYQQQVSGSNHQWLADEPAGLGGQDSGPAPFEFLAAALGTCTSMTLRMYADLKGIPLTGIHVQLECDKLEEDGVSRYRIVRQIRLEGELSQAQRQRMLEIANRCPVHRALPQPLQIHSELVA